MMKPDQLSPILQPFFEMQLARVAIWDGKLDVAVSHLDRADELLGQSFIQVFRNNLGTSSHYVEHAELYLEANALDQARGSLDEIFKIFPASAHAKLLSAKVYMAEGDVEDGRQALLEAQEIWSEADADFVLSHESRLLLDSL